jgi:phosphocarrier protein
MVEHELQISNKLGLHARASAKLVQLLQGYKCNAWLVHRGREINAKSIMGVMMLAAGYGQPIVLRCDGVDEAEALAAMVDLFNRKFDEGA